MATRTKPRKQQADARPRKSTAAQVSERVNIVWGLLASGARTAEVCHYASEKWGVDDRTTARYIAAATELIKAEAAKSREEAFPEHLAKRHQIYKRAMGAEDWRAALAAAQDEAKLRDLYPAERHKHEFDNVSDEELTSRANELARRIIADRSGGEAAQPVADDASGAADTPVDISRQ